MKKTIFLYNATSHPLRTKTYNKTKPPNNKLICSISTLLPLPGKAHRYCSVYCKIQTTKEKKNETRTTYFLFTRCSTCVRITFYELCVCSEGEKACTRKQSTIRMNANDCCYISPHPALYSLALTILFFFLIFIRTGRCGETIKTHPRSRAHYRRLSASPPRANPNATRPN